MSTDIYDLLGSALAARQNQKQPMALKAMSARTLLAAASGSAPPAPDPIILLNKFPIILNPSDYANALSTANPNGDMRPLWRFRQLVDPLPQFASYYTASSLSTEAAYVAVVQGAVMQDNSSFVAAIIAGAQQAVADQTYPDMDGTPGRWRPVFAVPDDWYNCLRNNSTSQLTLDLSGLVLTNPGSPPPKPVVPAHPRLPLSPGARLQNLALKKMADTVTASRVAIAPAITKSFPLAWKVLDANKAASTVALDTGSKVTSAKVNYLMVSLSRPWLDMMLFKTGGWYLDGQDAGFCSSGKNDGNGLMPLIPSSIIIGTSTSMNATWSKQDAQLIASATAKKQQLFLGPLPLNNVAASPADTPFYVLGWVMDQVPLSPRLAAPTT